MTPSQVSLASRAIPIHSVDRTLRVGLSSQLPFIISCILGRESSAQPCSDVQCAPNEACNDNHNGPVCTKNGEILLYLKPISTILPSAPATCAATSCLTGSACVEHPEGARCEAPQGGINYFSLPCMSNVHLHDPPLFFLNACFPRSPSISWQDLCQYCMP